MADKKYQVVTAAALAKDGEGHDVYLYQGAQLPESIGPEETARLLEGEFVREIEVVETIVIPEGDPTDKWKVDQLKAYAEGKSIDLGPATTKPEILAAIAAASAPAK